jgi:phage baseplate assembly protein W
MAYQIVNINEINNQTREIPIGIQLPFNGVDGLFTSTFTTVDQAVSNLKNLLLTSKGERHLQPKFGTDLPRVLFEPNTSELKALVEHVITEPVNFWLPYINITDIETTTADDDPTLDYNILVTISFQIENSTTKDSLNTITIIVNDNQLTVK